MAQKDLSYKQYLDLKEKLDNTLITDASLSDDETFSCLSVVNAIVAVNQIFVSSQTTLIVSDDSCHIVQKKLNQINPSFNSNIIFSDNSFGLALSLSLQTTQQIVLIVSSKVLNQGKTYEAFMQMSEYNSNLLVIIIDGHIPSVYSLDISKSWIQSMRVSKAYVTFKSDVKHLLSSNSIGKPILHTLTRVRDNIRNAIIDKSIFTQFGFLYLGPINAQDYQETYRTLSLYDIKKNVNILHLRTNVDAYKKVSLPKYKLINDYPDNYLHYMEMVGRVLSEQSDLFVVQFLENELECLKGFANKYPNNYYSGFNSVISLIDFAEGLCLLKKRVVLILSSKDVSLNSTYIDQKLNPYTNILIIVTQCGLDNRNYQDGIDDFSLTSRFTQSIYTGANIIQTQHLIDYCLSEKQATISVVRIPNAYEKIKTYTINHNWEIMNPEINARYAIYTFGSQTLVLLRKIKSNNLPIYIINCPNPFEVENHFITEQLRKNLIHCVYDLEDRFSMLTNILKNTQLGDIISYNMNRISKKGKGSDIKRKYQLDLDSVLNEILKMR